MSVLEGWNFCPRCRASLRRTETRASCGACGFVTYANPAPTVSALCERAGTILLARRSIDPHRGAWDLPGGFVEEFEDPLDALRRELREEASVDIDPLAFVGCFDDVYGDDGKGTLNLFWLARIVGGEPRAGDDAAELQWVDTREAARLPFAFRSINRALNAHLTQRASAVGVGG